MRLPRGNPSIRFGSSSESMADIGPVRIVNHNHGLPDNILAARKIFGCDCIGIEPRPDDAGSPGGLKGSANWNHFHTVGFMVRLAFWTQHNLLTNSAGHNIVVKLPIGGSFRYRAGQINHDCFSVAQFFRMVPRVFEKVV